MIRRFPAPLFVIAMMFSLVGACDATGTTRLGAAGGSPFGAGQVIATGGTGQSANLGTTLGTAFTVTVLDNNGGVFPGQTVTWAIASGGGALSSTTSTTGSNGNASTTYTAGTTAGTSRITATVTGMQPVTFSVNVTTAGTP